MVIDHETGIVYTNNSIPINIGWEYRLMGKGDDYIEVVDIQGRYVLVRGISGITLEASVLASTFDNFVKEVVNSDAAFLITEDSLFNITTEDDYALLAR